MTSTVIEWSRLRLSPQLLLRKRLALVQVARPDVLRIGADRFVPGDGFGPVGPRLGVDRLEVELPSGRFVGGRVGGGCDELVGREPLRPGPLGGGLGDRAAACRTVRL